MQTNSFFLKVFLHMFVCYYYHFDIEWDYFSCVHLLLLLLLPCLPIYLPSSKPIPTVHNCFQCDNCDFVLLLCVIIIFENDYRSILWHLSVLNLLILPMDFPAFCACTLHTEHIFIGQLAVPLLFRKYLPRTEWSTIYCLKRK